MDMTSVWQSHGSEIRVVLGFAVVVATMAWKVRGLFEKLFHMVAGVDAKAERIADHVKRQNGRIHDLETGVMYTDTSQAMHGQSVQATQRLESDVQRVDSRLDAIQATLLEIRNAPKPP